MNVSLFTLFIIYVVILGLLRIITFIVIHRFYPDIPCKDAIILAIKLTKVNIKDK